MTQKGEDDTMLESERERHRERERKYKTRYDTSFMAGDGDNMRKRFFSCC